MSDAQRGTSRLILFSPIEQLRVRNFEDDAVVFDPVSWDAHVLNPAARAVLELLLGAPRTESEVVTFLVNSLSPDERGCASDHARRLLAELQSLGLVKAIEEGDRAVG